MPTVSTPSVDPLIETQVFWSKYHRQILAAVAVVFLGIAAFGAYRFYDSWRDAAAADLLTRAKVAADYQKIIADYPGSGAAASAHLLLANQLRNEQKLAEANKTLQSFVGKNPQHLLATTARMAIAANLESMGKADEALKTYSRIAAQHPQSYNAPLALLAQVPLLRQKGQIEEARRVCETVLTQYRDSYASAEASRYLQMLKPPASPAVGASQPAASGAPSVPPAATSPASSVAPTP